jgi:hypothetical protein
VALLASELEVGSRFVSSNAVKECLLRRPGRGGASAWDDNDISGLSSAGFVSSEFDVSFVPTLLGTILLPLGRYVKLNWSSSNTLNVAFCPHGTFSTSVESAGTESVTLEARYKLLII